MKTDIKQHVTDTIIAEIETGTPPWRKPWTGDETGVSFPLRHNGEAYRGINVLMLWATAMKKGYQSARWMTFKQALDLGGCVRKGEKCTKSVYYGTFDKKIDAESGETEAQTSRFAKCNNVFNADQIDGLPDEYYIRPAPPRDLGTVSDAALDVFFDATGAEIVTSDVPRAYYKPSEDHIQMPPIATFYEASGYFGTLAHELIHWTGSDKRLDRIKKFQGKEAHAFEELVAEIGACFLCLQIGVEPQFDQSAAYIEGWLEALKSEKELIFKAAAEAQKAVDYIADIVGETAKTAAA